MENDNDTNMMTDFIEDQMKPKDKVVEEKESLDEKKKVFNINGNTISIKGMDISDLATTNILSKILNMSDFKDLRHDIEVRIKVKKDGKEDVVPHNQREIDDSGSPVPKTIIGLPGFETGEPTEI